MRAIMITTVIAAAVIVGFLGYSRQGHQLLYKAGFTAACGGSDNC
jgi:hypothetical protein